METLPLKSFHKEQCVLLFVFIAERFHFSGNHNSQWCLTLGKW